MTTAMTLQRLADRQEIVDATLRYSRGVDRLDEESLRSAYHEDATDDHGTFQFSRCDDFVNTIIPLLRKGYTSTSHILHNQLIEFTDETTALGETYYTAVQVHDVDGELIQETCNGRYLDRFERRDGVGWRIAHRQVVLDSNTSQAVQPWRGTSDVSIIPHGRRDRSDPLYTLEASTSREA